MTLVLDNAAISRVLTMDAAIEAMEAGYRELAEGTGGNRSRAEIVAPGAAAGTVYALKSMDGVSPGTGIGSVRINSDIIGWPEVAGAARRVKVPAAPGERYVGLVLLFSTETGEPLAIFPDGVVQRMRVGATSAIGARHLAREDSRIAAVIGSGWQAGAQAMAIRAVRPIERIRCFSPTEAHRTAFAREMTDMLGIPVEPAGSVADALADSDVVMCATSSIEAVLDAVAVRPGVHYSTIKPPELTPAAIRACDRVAVHLRENAPQVVRTRGTQLAEDHSGGLAPDADIDETAFPELTDLVAGRARGREAADEATCFLNYSGIGFQFTMVGGAAYRLARDAGLGRELPTDWFTQTEHP